MADINVRMYWITDWEYFPDCDNSVRSNKVAPKNKGFFMWNTYPVFSMNGISKIISISFVTKVAKLDSEGVFNNGLHKYL